MGTGQFKKFLTAEWPILLLIVVYFSSLFGSMGQYVTLILLPLLIAKNGFWKYFDATCVWILVFSVSYVIIITIYGLSINGKGYIIIFSLFPLLFYLTGRYLMDHWFSQIRILFMLLLVPMAYVVFSGVVTDVMRNGFLNESRDVVVNGLIFAATLDGVRISLCLAAFGMIFAVPKNKVERIYKYTLLILGALAIFCTIHLLNRTGIIIAIVSCLAVLLANIRTYSFSNIIIGVVLLALIGYGVYPVLLEYKVVDSYKEREDDFGAGYNTAGGRTVRWMDAVDKIVKQPMGGGIYKRGYRYYAHNFWLDVAELTGILPFVALMGCTIIGFWKNFQVIRCRKIPLFLRSWLITMNTGFVLACFVEPIMEGLPAYAFLLFFFWGMTSILYEQIILKNDAEIVV